MLATNTRSSIWYTVVILSLLSSCTSKEVAPVLTPDQELASFQLEAGLRIELVASEPMVQDPVAINFDEAGRLWVVEMRGYMPNMEMEGEEDPVGRISILIDQDADGKMDKSIIFLDSLVLPRALAFVPGGVLIAENKPLWFVEDLDGDLVADQKTLLDSTYGGRGLVEHSPNALWRNIDNWYYNAKSTVRYKFGLDHQLITDTTEFRGQWGMSHDDEGRLYYNYNWSQLHADLVPANYFSRNPNHVSTSGIDHGLTLDRSIYPIRPNPAVNRGYIPGTLNEAGKLQEFTSACSPLVYRGDLLPAEYTGNAFVCEPAGNLIKRNVVRENGFLLSAYDPQPGQSFLASTDERFRPVYLANGPDGALYIADMYRGINQHGAYMTPYLKEQIIQRKLDQPINKGRIWRIVPENWKNQTRPDLSTASVQELVNHLSSENGWIRDVAQRLLIAQNQQQSISLLETQALEGASELARLHALWTLEGMHQIKSEILFKALDDRASSIQTTALRILEALAKKDEGISEKLYQKISSSWSTASPEMALQIALTAGIFQTNNKLDLLVKISKKQVSAPLMRDAILSSLKDEEALFLERLSKDSAWEEQDLNQSIFFEMLAAAITKKEQSHTQGGDTDKKQANLKGADLQAFTKGKMHYLNACAGCHGTDGKGLKRFAPPLVESEWVIGDEKRLALLLLHGLEGPIDVNGTHYDAPDILPVMPAHSTLPDQDIANILTYIRNDWGNQASAVEGRMVGKTRVTSQGRVIPWTAEELLQLPESE